MTTLAAGVLCACGGGGGGGDATNTAAEALTLTLPASYILRWSDTFSVSGSPGSAWTYDIGAPLLGGSVWGNSERQYYTSDATNVFVSNGELTIQPAVGVPAAAPTRSPTLLGTSARIKTDTAAYYNALNGTPYGFYEIRAKVPCLAGAWPAIWMMGKDGEWPARGEIDIMEWFGRYFINPIDQVQSGVHTTNNSGASSRYQKANVSALCTAYHNFQMHWTASEILIGVDGVSTFSYKKPVGAGVADWPFDQPAHIILNVAIGGNLGGDVNLANIPAMALKVDHVKVWQKP
jgi:beta-glucanase (GH16 family)